MGDELITASQAGQILGLHYKKAQRLARDGAWPVAHQLPGPRGMKLFRRADVLRWAAEQAEKAAS